MNALNRCALGALIVAMLAAAGCGVVTEPLVTMEGETVLHGVLMRPRCASGKAPGVIVFHEWYGLNDYARLRARQLAELGYVALAADVYGGGEVADSRKRAGELAGKYRGDRPLMRRRARAALDALVATGRVDPDRIGAIGYCFGGTVALELARSGAPVAAVVPFHGGLGTPEPDDAKNIRGRVLVLHGAADPHAPMEEVSAFTKAMNDAKVDWRMVLYGNTAHAFTNPAAGDDPSTGAAYNAAAAAHAWQAMRDFFEETLR